MQLVNRTKVMKVKEGGKERLEQVQKMSEIVPVLFTQSMTNMKMCKKMENTKKLLLKSK